MPNPYKSRYACLAGLLVSNAGFQGGRTSSISYSTALHGIQSSTKSREKG